METKTGAKIGQVTAVANVRDVPLKKLVERSEQDLGRVIPDRQATKAPVAAFDASL